MYIAHVQYYRGESFFHIGDTPADIFTRLTDAFGHEGMMALFCSDEKYGWSGAALTLGNLEQIGTMQTVHWRNASCDKVAICNYPDMAKPIDRMDALRDAIAVAEANDRLLPGRKQPEG